MDTNAEQDAQLYYQEENAKGENGNFEPTGFGVMKAKVEVFGHAGCEASAGDWLGVVVWSRWIGMSGSRLLRGSGRGSLYEVDSYWRGYLRTMHMKRV